jgi:hypothetical protein
VQLEVVPDLVDAAGLAVPLRVAAPGGHRLGERHPVGIAPVAEPAEVLPAERAAAEQRRVEASVLLVHERGQPDRPARLDPPLPEQADGVQPPHDPERAVEAAALGHGVDVRAHQNRGAVAGVPAREEVARRVDVRVEAEPAATPHEPVVSGSQLGAPGEAGHPRAPAREGRQRLQVPLELAHAPPRIDLGGGG